MMRIIYFLILLSFYSTLLFPQDSSLFTTERRKAFADYLFCEKDYLRAAEEYEAINRTQKDDSLEYKIGLCFLKMNDFGKAKSYFNDLRNSFLGEPSRLLYLKSSYLLNKKIDLDTDSLATQFVNKEFKTAFQRLDLALQIKAGVNYSNLPNIYEGSDTKTLKSFAEKFMHPQLKSPIAAALLSALIPGSGKIYTENIGDGVTAFLVTGLFTFLSYDNFHAHHDTRGWIFAGLTAFFYGGNVYGSYISARNYNLEQQETLNNEFDSYLSSKNYFVPKEIEGDCK